MFCDICRKADMDLSRGCTTMQKFALNDQKSSHTHIEASRVHNLSMAMVKHVEKLHVACNKALKIQHTVVLYMANTKQPPIS